MKKLLVIALISLLACNGSGDGEKDTPQDTTNVNKVDTTIATTPQ
jgi:hypothetical protein